MHTRYLYLQTEIALADRETTFLRLNNQSNVRHHTELYLLADNPAFASFRRLAIALTLKLQVALSALAPDYHYYQYRGSIH